MYDTAKKAREALKSKARRLASEKYEKVSSADWSPSEPLNADVKTGARPVSRRAYKSGGAVEGSCGKMRADRKPRKAGGKVDSEKAEAKQIAIAKVNRNVKEANEEREGIKHVGGFKKGGRAEKETGGGLFMNGKRVVSPTAAKPIMDKSEQRSSTPAEIKRAEAHMSQMGKSVSSNKGMSADEARKFLEGRKEGGRTKKQDGGALDRRTRGAQYAREAREAEKARSILESETGRNTTLNRFGYDKTPRISEKLDNMKSGGRTKKMMGGPMMGGMDPRMGMVKDKALDFGGQGITPGVSAMKKGGKVEKHADEAMDKALIKKMVKPEARTARKDGGKVKSKGKTEIAIVINAGGKDQKPDMGMMPPADIGAMDALPIPVPPKGPMPAGGMPMPPMGGGMPMPPAPPAAASGAPPMMRKDGGRITKKASSYKDMEAGAGSGEGRLQKTDIAAKQPKPGLKRGVIVDDNKGYPNKVNGAVGGRTARASGGKTYRSYKDMDAGAGSGKGRLEKTEIEARKS